MDAPEQNEKHFGSTTVSTPKVEINHIYPPEIPTPPPPPPADRKWKVMVCIIEHALIIVASVAFGYYLRGETVKIYQVGKDRVIHNCDCRFFVKDDDGRDCAYCGGRRK